ncbi:unnamed protein product, partial [marine sediment metagenome]
MGAWFANPDGCGFEVYESDHAQHLVYVGTDPVLYSWRHIAATFDGTKLKIYENGILKQTTTYAGPIGASSSDDLYIGIQPNMLMPFAGLIDEVKIYNYARSADQIAEDAGLDAPKSIKVHVDNTPPETTLAISGTMDYTCTLTATDNAVGVKEIQ